MKIVDRATSQPECNSPDKVSMVEIILCICFALPFLCRCMFQTRVWAVFVAAVSTGISFE
jgi:hypothetical protein